MDPLPELPIPVGTSPFHIKGIAVQGFCAYFSKRVPGGLDAIAERLTDLPTRRFLAQRFLDASWYDFLPFLQILGAGAAIIGASTAQFVAEHSMWQTERDVRTVHRLLLLATSPEKVAPRLAAAVARYFDFTSVKLISVGKGGSVMAVSGLPAILLPWYKVSVNAGATTILAMAGARNLQAAYTVAEPDGEKGGLALVRFRVRRTWS